MPNRVSQETSPDIKVDHQDRPDLDDIYQKVVQMKGQGGGWSLTVFVTPQVRVINLTKNETYETEHPMTPRQVEMVLAGSLINLVRQKSHNLEYS